MEAENWVDAFLCQSSDRLGSKGYLPTVESKGGQLDWGERRWLQSREEWVKNGWGSQLQVKGLDSTKF